MAPRHCRARMGVGVRTMVRRIARLTFFVLAALVLFVTGLPPAVPAQVTLEDVVFRSLEITAELRPVPYREICERVPGTPPGTPPACRITSFGSVKGRTVAQLQVTSPTPVSTVRMFIEPDYSVKISSTLPMTPRRDGSYWVLVFNPALAPGTTVSLTFEYEGKTWPVYEDFIWVSAGDLYPIVVSPFGDFYSPNRSFIKTTVTAPSGYILASSGRMTRQESGGVQTFQWESTEPVASISVVGGKTYTLAERKAGDLSLTLLLRPRSDRFADQIADFTLKSAQYYSRLLYPFPFDRLTVLSAPFGRGVLGVGYPGLMMITEDAFTGGQSGDLSRDSFRLLTIAHEAAHTYFPHQTSGRGVAAAWMSEGFAEYLGLMTVEVVLGKQAFRKELDEDRVWYASVAGRDRPVAAYTFINSGTADAAAVRYAKGAFILHMLRFVVGDETFQKILQTYATRFRNQSVRVDDFAQVSSEVAGRDLNWFFQEWIHDIVLPDYTIAEVSSVPAEGAFRLTAKVRNLGSGVMPVDVLFELDNGERVVQRIDVGSRTEVSVIVTAPRPARRVEADPEKWLLQSNYTNDAATVR